MRNEHILEENIMKFTIYFALFLAFAFSTVQIAQAQSEQRETIKINKQKKFSQSKITIKFVSLIEDSRCPIGVNCIQAGNARIKVEISNGTNKEIFEINTTMGVKGASFGGYAINLIELTPIPRNNVKINQNSYKAKFSIVRLTR